MEDACGISPSLPPAGGRCLPKQTCFVSELRFVVFFFFFSSFFFPSPLVLHLTEHSRKAKQGREKQTHTLRSGAGPRHLP